MLSQIGPNMLEFGVDRGLETLVILSTFVMFLGPLVVAALLFSLHVRRRKMSSMTQVGGEEAYSNQYIEITARNKDERVRKVA